MPSFSCHGCRRTFEATAEQLARRVARGQTRCQLCGGALQLPTAAVAAAAPAPLPYDPSRRLTVPCAGCRRTFVTPLGHLVEALHGGRTRCQLCGGALALPDEVGVALEALRAAGRVATPRSVACPACDRPAATTTPGPPELTCGTCGARFLAPPPGDDVGLVPRRPGPAATVADVEAARALADLGLAGDLLRARAALGELSREDLAAAASAWARLAAWSPSPEGPPRLPVPVRDALDLAPPLLFPSRPFVLERAGPAAVLTYVVEVGAGSVVASGLGSSLLTNAVGLASLMTLGVGVFQTRPAADGDAGPRSQRRARLVLEPEVEVGDGGTALRLEQQLDAEPPTPAPAAAQRGLAEALASRRPAALAWAGALALHGDWVRGPVAFALGVAAVRRRLTALGGALARDAEALAPALCPGLAR